MAKNGAMRDSGQTLRDRPSPLGILRSETRFLDFPVTIR